jgi:uncharacterized protein (DUF433 family)
MMGKPTLSGTRMTVELILDKVAAGETVEQIPDPHERVTIEGIRSALVSASKALRTDVIYAMEKVFS